MIDEFGSTRSPEHYDDGVRFGTSSEMISEIKALRSENERLKAALKEIEEDYKKLEDPVAVHLNMLAGKIAKISLMQCAHLWGEDMACITSEVLRLRLRVALEPFAKMFDDDSEKIFAGIGEEESKRHEVERWPTVYDLRRAKARITGSQTEEPSSATRTDQPDGEAA